MTKDKVVGHLNEFHEPSFVFEAIFAKILNCISVDKSILLGVTDK